MIPVKQKTYNDCFRACMASMLEIPNDDSLPHIDSDNWHIEWKRLLENFGLCITFAKMDCFPEGYWLASVKSKNFKSTLHSIIMYGNRVEFDPSLKEIYSKGKVLSIEEIEDFCWIGLSDVGKIKNLDIFRTKILNKHKNDLEDK